MKTTLLTLPLLAALSLVMPQFVHAEDIFVNTTVDENPPNAKDCSDMDPNTICSLREAVLYADANGVTDTIHLPEGTYPLTIQGNNQDASAGDLDIVNEDLTIQKEGPGTVYIDGTNLGDRVFNVTSVNFTVKGISVIGNKLSGDLHWGCIQFLGDNTHTLSVEDVSIFNCESNGAGGAIFASSNGMQRTNLSLKNVSLSANECLGSGGAISSSNVNITLDSVSFYKNIAAVNGGAVFSSIGTINILNTTFAQNEASEGAAIYLRSNNGNGNDVSANIGFTTIAENKATGANNTGGLFVDKAGNQPATANVKASIIYGNYFVNPGSANNCSVLNGGVIASDGFNVFEDAMDCAGGMNDQQGDPKLSFEDPFTLGYYSIASQANGGIAEGAVPNANCTFNNVNLTVDQMGNPRPIGTDCDSGAFELALCGDGNVTIGEECDDGNNDNTDACVNLNGVCYIADCGDGFVQTGVEECDDGNFVNGDGCNNNCQLEPPNCGNGSVDPGEQCDDGNVIDGDGCSAICQLEVPANCGNGSVDPGEQCDDGNVIDGDGCSATCQLEAPANCGDGNVDPGEQCDDGNVIDGDGCSAACQLEIPANCGNGSVDPGEQCDDGNIVDGDGCSATCQIEVQPACGDGNVDAGEQCDDGNVIDGDGCSSICQTEVAPPNCGDGHLDADEECDDGNLSNGDGCTIVCQIEVPPHCGDGHLDADESCDDGNLESGDGCTRACRFELRGNGGCSLSTSSSTSQAGSYMFSMILAMGMLLLRRWKQS